MGCDPRSYVVEIEDITPNTIDQLRNINTTVLPMRFSEAYYSKVARPGNLSKFGTLSSRFLLADLDIHFLHSSAFSQRISMMCVWDQLLPKSRRILVKATMPHQPCAVML